MNNKQLQNENEISLPCTSQEQFDASQCGPCILSDEEKIILSAMVLQKGEAEAGAIFRKFTGAAARLHDPQRHQQLCCIGQVLPCPRDFGAGGAIRVHGSGRDWLSV